jgi:hypothetical protein
LYLHRQEVTRRIRGLGSRGDGHGSDMNRTANEFQLHAVQQNTHTAARHSRHPPGQMEVPKNDLSTLGFAIFPLLLQLGDAPVRKSVVGNTRTQCRQQRRQPLQPSKTRGNGATRLQALDMLPPELPRGRLDMTSIFLDRFLPGLLPFTATYMNAFALFETCRLT